MSWGLRQEMTPPHEESSYTVHSYAHDRGACGTVRCYPQRALDLGFDAVGLALENPMMMWSTGVVAAGTFLVSQLPTIQYLLGIVFTFLVINIIALIYLCVANVVAHALRILWEIIKLPIFTIVFRIVLAYGHS